MDRKLNSFDISKIQHFDDFEYSVQMTRWLLNLLGIWPLRSSSYSKILLRWLTVFLCFFLQAFLIVPLCLQMFIIEKDLTIKLKMTGILLFSLANLLKYFLMIERHRTVDSCIMDIAKDWHYVNGTESKNLMLKYAKMTRYFTTVSAVFLYGGGLPWCTVLPLYKGTRVVNNVTYRYLAYPSHFVFFNPYVRPVWDYIFVTHWFCAFVRYSLTCGVCSFAILCTMHICGQCSVTSSTLCSLGTNYNRKTFKNAIRQHLRCLRFAYKLEGLLNVIFLVDYLFCTSNICMLGYYVITGFGKREILESIIYILMLTAQTFNIFIISYIGEQVTEKCQSIGEVTYMMNWYQFSSKDARNIVLILATTQRPVELTAGKMFKLSIGSFGNIIKGTVSYLNLLITVTADHV